MIQGAGITCSIAFTHRHYRARQKASREQLATLRYRNEVCRKHGISRAEYLRRFERWRELRALVASIRASQEHRDDRAEVAEWMIEKAQQRAGHKARLAEQAQREKVRREFESFMVSPPVDRR